jgi:cell division protein FtsL
MTNPVSISRITTLLLLGVIVVPVSVVHASSVVREISHHTTEAGHLHLRPSNTPPPAGVGNHNAPPVHFAFIFPLLSASAIMWAMHRNKQLCCSRDTSIDESIPSEIMVEETATKTQGRTAKEDIELQSVVGGKSRASLKNDPVVESSLLNESDWTDENDEPQETSFSWMEKSSSAKYHYLND